MVLIITLARTLTEHVINLIAEADPVERQMWEEKARAEYLFSMGHTP